MQVSGDMRSARKITEVRLAGPLTCSLTFSARKVKRLEQCRKVSQKGLQGSRSST